MKQTITSVERVNTGIAQVSYRGEVPESGYRGEVPESGYRSEIAVTDQLDFSDGTSFRFRFIPQNDGQYWEVDILEQPDYANLQDDEESTGRIASARPDCQYGILFENPFLIDSKEKAKAEAKIWAEKTWRYLNHGIALS